MHSDERVHVLHDCWARRQDLDLWVHMDALANNGNGILLCTCITPLDPQAYGWRHGESWSASWHRHIGARMGHWGRTSRRQTTKRTTLHTLRNGASAYVASLIFYRVRCGPHALTPGLSQASTGVCRRTTQPSRWASITKYVHRRSALLGLHCMAQTALMDRTPSEELLSGAWTRHANACSTPFDGMVLSFIRNFDCGKMKCLADMKSCCTHTATQPEVVM